MILNPIDIILIITLLTFVIFGYKNGLLIELQKTISLLLGIILTGIILNKLSFKFIFLQSKVDILYLSCFLITMVITILIVNFLLNVIMERIDLNEIDFYLNIFLGATIAFIKGIIIISLLIFIFDTTPIEKHNKDKIYNKLQSESLFFKQCHKLKNLLF